MRLLEVEVDTVSYSKSCNFDEARLKLPVRNLVSVDSNLSLNHCEVGLWCMRGEYFVFVNFCIHELGFVSDEVNSITQLQLINVMST